MPMQDTIQRQILDALLVALRPLARALLKAGIGYREFAEISKAAFVDIGTNDYGLRGRPTNISRVAVMTGLTRKEVRRLRDKTAAGNDTVVLRSTPMAVILHHWYTDPEFGDAAGKPKGLAFDGECGTFSALVRKHGGDIPPGAMRTELRRIDAIEELADGSLRPLKRNGSGLDVHDRLITGLVRTFYPAALALAHNTSADKDDTWISRTASTHKVRESDVPRIRRISSDRLREFVESIDDLFVAYETLYEDSESVSHEKTVGVGVFYFEDHESINAILKQPKIASIKPAKLNLNEDNLQMRKS